MKRRIRTFSGTKDPAVSRRELNNRAIARKAAAEGIVLMKNEGILPLQKGSKIALFGAGAGRTIKGGTGSGDVNEREVVSIYQGLTNAGFEITSRAWIEDFETVYKKSREDWRDSIFRESEGRSPLMLTRCRSVARFRRKILAAQTLRFMYWRVLQARELIVLMKKEIIISQIMRNRIWK